MIEFVLKEMSGLQRNFSKDLSNMISYLQVGKVRFPQYTEQIDYELKYMDEKLDERIAI